MWKHIDYAAAFVKQKSCTDYGPDGLVPGTYVDKVK